MKAAGSVMVLRIITGNYVNIEENRASNNLCLTGFALLFWFKFHALQAGRAENNGRRHLSGFEIHRLTSSRELFVPCNKKIYALKAV